MTKGVNSQIRILGLLVIIFSKSNHLPSLIVLQITIFIKQTNAKI